MKIRPETLLLSVQLNGRRSSGNEPKEADGLRNGNQKISQNTDVDLLHPLHSVGGSLYSAIGSADDAEIDDDHKHRRKRRGR